jgi:hypothetical protein
MRVQLNPSVRISPAPVPPKFDGQRFWDEYVVTLNRRGLAPLLRITTERVLANGHAAMFPGKPVPGLMGVGMTGTPAPAVVT